MALHSVSFFANDYDHAKRMRACLAIGNGLYVYDVMPSIKNINGNWSVECSLVCGVNAWLKVLPAITTMMICELI